MNTAGQDLNIDQYVSVLLVQQSVWDSPRLSMPLAAGYLKAAAEEDSLVQERCRIRIVNMRGGNQQAAMLAEMFADSIPDVIAFSVFGWNILSFAALAATFKQLNPNGLVVFGGTHVANQAENVMARFPVVDVIVNGEGEWSFRDVLKAYLVRRDKADLVQVEGISVQLDGKVFTTMLPKKIADLGEIPSPVLTGAIPLVGPDGRFLYDVALMETNRGCPYRCAFCYWGGAVGQKVRVFPRDRLRKELEVLVAAGAQHLVLCDANFGMLQSDLDFIEDVIELKASTGLPLSVDTSWAKNKGRIFREIVAKMAEAGLASSFTLALQTQNDEALGIMHRRNMKVNDWAELVEWLEDQGLQCYAELVWGSPGETPRSFLDGYDRLARKIPQIATYPLLVLPNTDYADRRKELGIVTVKGIDDDFDYIVASNSFSVQEHIKMQHFLFWARTVGEHRFFRLVFAAARTLLNLEQSQVLLSLDKWLHEDQNAAAERLTSRCGSIVSAQDVSLTMHELYTSTALHESMREWWSSLVSEQPLDENRRTLALAAFEYDFATLPIYDAAELPAGVRRAPDGSHYRRYGLAYPHNLQKLLDDVHHGYFEVPENPSPWRTDIEYLRGFAPHVDSHEISAKYFGVPVPPADETGEQACGA